MSETPLDLPPLGEQRSENGRAERNNQYDRLRLQDFGVNREARVTKMAKPVDRGQSNRHGNDEGTCCAENRLPSGGEPQQAWKYQRGRDHGIPKLQRQ